MKNIIYLVISIRLLLPSQLIGQTINGKGIGLWEKCFEIEKLEFKNNALGDYPEDNILSAIMWITNKCDETIILKYGFSGTCKILGSKSENNLIFGECRERTETIKPGQRTRLVIINTRIDGKIVFLSFNANEVNTYSYSSSNSSSSTNSNTSSQESSTGQVRNYNDYKRDQASTLNTSPKPNNNTTDYIKIHQQQVQSTQQREAERRAEEERQRQAAISYQNRQAENDAYNRRLEEERKRREIEQSNRMLQQLEREKQQSQQKLQQSTNELANTLSMIQQQNQRNSQLAEQRRIEEANAERERRRIEAEEKRRAENERRRMESEYNELKYSAERLRSNHLELVWEFSNKFNNLISADKFERSNTISHQYFIVYSLIDINRQVYDARLRRELKSYDMYLLDYKGKDLRPNKPFVKISKNKSGTFPYRSDIEEHFKKINKSIIGPFSSEEAANNFMQSLWNLVLRYDPAVTYKLTEEFYEYKSLSSSSWSTSSSGEKSKNDDIDWSTPKIKKVNPQNETNTKIENASDPINEELKIQNPKDVDRKSEPEMGLANFYNFIAENLIYPLNAKEKGIQGIVFIEFQIDPNGLMKNLKVIRGFDVLCNEEALRVLKLFTNSGFKWTPAYLNGEKVTETQVIPIRFSL